MRHRKKRSIAVIEVLEDRSLLSATSINQLWDSVDAIAATEVSQQLNDESTSSVAFSLNSDVLTSALASAPIEFSQGTPVEISLPRPTGEFARFQIVESPIMAPALAAKFPEIKTYSGQGIDDPTETVRFDITSAGLHVQVWSSLGRFFIDPMSTESGTAYVSRHGAVSERLLALDSEVEHELFHEHDESHDHSLVIPVDSLGLLSTGNQLRTYQLAVAATGEYTSFHGGTVAGGQSAIVTAINRVNGIYETELAVRLELVGNNDQLVFTNSYTDPYSNNNGGAMLSQNQTTIDNVIGDANYDIGHVFSTGGGGVAFLGVVGVAGSKAGGVTGLPSPTGDVFYVDYVAHEIGHQFGATHTFNGDSGSCAGGNQTASTAFEPGSGSTIMGYAGICGNDNLQSNSDPYFHSASFDQIVNYTTTGVGNSSATITSTGNNIPTVSAGGDFTIPARRVCIGRKCDR